jgi:hypothetical protein
MARLLSVNLGLPRDIVEGGRDAAQQFSRLIGEQPQRWRGGRKGDQPRYRCVTHTEQAARIGHPVCRLVLLGPWASSSGTCASTAAASCRALSSGDRARRTAIVRQLARAVNKPSTAFCKTGEW